MSLLSLIITEIPVLAAGGVADERTTCPLGVEGVYVGSAMLAAEESPLAPQMKAALVKANADDLRLFRGGFKFLRGLRSPLVDQMTKLSDEGRPQEAVFAADHGFAGLITGMVNGDANDDWTSFGTGIGLIHQIEPAAQIVNRLYREVPKDDR